MKSTLKKTSDLGRRLVCIIPHEDVQKEFNKRINKTSRKARIDGFRPGKVPQSVVKERYGESIFREVSMELIEDAYREAMREYDLKTVGEPKFEDMKSVPGSPLEFTVDVEVFPEFALQMLDKLKIEKLVSEVTGEDVDDVITQLRRNQGEWKTVERAIKKGDRVEFGFDNEKYKDLLVDSGDSLTVIVGDSNLLGGIDEQLIGSKKDDKLKVKAEFPKDFKEEKFAGKSKKLKVIIIKIEECDLVEMDEKFFQKCGLSEGNIEKLKEMVREGMQHKLKQSIDNDLHEKVTDNLLKMNKFSVPETLIAGEIKNMRHSMMEKFGLEEDKANELADDLFSVEAERRVKTYLIFNKIIETKELTVSNEAFEARLDKLSTQYEDSNAVKNHYRTNQQAYKNLELGILHDEVYQLILASSTVEEKYCQFKDVVKN